MRTKESASGIRRRAPSTVKCTQVPAVAHSSSTASSHRASGSQWWVKKLRYTAAARIVMARRR